MKHATSNALRWILSAGLLANGLAMLLMPALWYVKVPGVIHSGPLNVHFVRDIGCAYCVAALGLGWQAWRPIQGAPAALAGAAFLVMHALVHFGEALTGEHGWGNFMRDSPLVIFPALLALVLVSPPLAAGPVIA